MKAIYAGSFNPLHAGHIDILYDIKTMLKDVYRNYKKAQNKIKELKMSGDFSE